MIFTQSLIPTNWDNLIKIRDKYSLQTLIFMTMKMVHELDENG
jgi:hypothetical protein